MVDTSSWIALFRNYPREHNGETWAGVDRLIDQGLIKSPRIVHDEISARQDDLLSWVTSRQDKIFLKPDRDMLDRVVRINSRFPLLNKNRHRFDADLYVIALAVVLRKRGVSGRTPVVVTEEADRPDRPTKIPFVARQCRISCIDLAALLEREGLGR